MKDLSVSTAASKTATSNPASPDTCRIVKRHCQSLVDLGAITDDQLATMIDALRASAPATEPADTWITFDAAMELLGLSRPTLAKHLAGGLFKNRKVGPRLYRVSKNSILQFLEGTPAAGEVENV